jgi:hypothetical protein
MPVASACAGFSSAAASGSSRPPFTTFENCTGSPSAEPKTPDRNAKTAKTGRNEGPVPSQLQFSRHQSVLRVSSVILAESAIGSVAGRLKLPRQGVTHLVAAMGSLCFGLFRRGDRSRLDHPQESVLDGIVNAQSAKGDTTGLAVIKQTAPAGIAWNIVLDPSIAKRQLAAATSTSKQTGEQGVAMLGCSMMPACRRVVTYHLADRFGPFPTHIALMHARNQRQPLRARLAADCGPDRRSRMAY